MSAPTKTKGGPAAPSRERLIEALRVLEAQGLIADLDVQAEGFRCRVVGTYSGDPTTRAIALAVAHLRRTGELS